MKRIDLVTEKSCFLNTLDSSKLSQATVDMLKENEIEYSQVKGSVSDCVLNDYMLQLTENWNLIPYFALPVLGAYSKPYWWCIYKRI